MSEKEWRKLDALEHVAQGDWTMAMGAQAAGVCLRQFRRLRKAYRDAEDKVSVVIHGHTGHRPHNRVSESVVADILELRKETYKGFTDTHFTEKLVEVHKIKVSRQTVQRVLRASQIATPQARKAKKRRKRRERRSRAGWLVLWDGSLHDWLEGRGSKLCLMGAIDDATGKVLRGAHFVAEECSASYLRVLHDMVRHHGIPLEIYGDKHSCLRRNDDHWSLEEQLQGRQEPPQVQRAAESLGITVIWAHSPQAKGRIERAWKTFQDRLVSELRLANCSTVEEANEILERYRHDHNRRFARQPKDKKPAWRKPAKGHPVAEVCAFHTTAKVYSDSTIRYQGKVIDLPAKGPSLAGKTVELRHMLSGQLRIYLGDQRVHQLAFGAPTKAPQRKRRRPPSANKPEKKPKLTFQQIAEKRKNLAKTKVA